MKRFLSTVLVAMLIVTCLSTVAFAAGTASVSVTGGTTNAVPGNTYTVTYTVKGEFNNFEMYVRPSAGLELISISDNVTANLNPNSAKYGKVAYAQAGNTDSYSFTATFKLSADAQCGKTYTAGAEVILVGDETNTRLTIGSVGSTSFKFDHDWDTGVVDPKPTCTEAGIKTLTCTICGETDTETVPATGHKAGNWETSKPATCTAAGEQVKKCTVCQEVVDRKVIDALGHDEDNMVEIERVDPTCTEDGYVKSKCPRCNDYVKTDILDALGHDYDVKTTTATCTEGGITTYVCKRCGHTYTDDATSALGHDYKLVDSKAATCTEAGFENYECSRCKDTYTTELKALGHQWCENFDCEHEHEHYDEEYHWFLCLICGEKKDAERHNHNIEKEGYLFCKCGHWIEVDEPGIDPEPKPGDYSFVMYAGIAALIAMMAAAAYVYKRKMAN